MLENGYEGRIFDRRNIWESWAIRLVKERSQSKMGESVVVSVLIGKKWRLM